MQIDWSEVKARRKKANLVAVLSVLDISAKRRKVKTRVIEAVVS